MPKRRIQTTEEKEKDRNRRAIKKTWTQPIASNPIPVQNENSHLDAVAVNYPPPIQNPISYHSASSLLLWGSTSQPTLPGQAPQGEQEDFDVDEFFSDLNDPVTLNAVADVNSLLPSLDTDGNTEGHLAAKNNDVPALKMTATRGRKRLPTEEKLARIKALTEEKQTLQEIIQNLKDRYYKASSEQERQTLDEQIKATRNASGKTTQKIWDIKRRLNDDDKAKLEAAPARPKKSREEKKKASQAYNKEYIARKKREKEQQLVNEYRQPPSSAAFPGNTFTLFSSHDLSLSTNTNSNSDEIIQKKMGI